MEIDLDKEVRRILKENACPLTSLDIKNDLEERDIKISEKRIKKSLLGLEESSSKNFVRIQLSTNTKPSWMYVVSREIEDDILRVLDGSSEMMSWQISDKLGCSDRHCIDSTLSEMKKKDLVEFDSTKITWKLVDINRKELIESLSVDILSTLSQMSTEELKTARSQLNTMLGK